MKKFTDKVNESKVENRLPTAEELFKKYSNLYQFEEGSPEYLIDKEDFETTVIEFTKLHVGAALKAAVKNVVINDYDMHGQHCPHIEEESILNAYPESLIK